MSKPNILIRLLAWVWHALDGLRKRRDLKSDDEQRKRRDAAAECRSLNPFPCAWPRRHRHLLEAGRWLT